MKDKLQHLPTNPGCYLMLNKHDTVIYVGKAKNLKNRIKSYFTGAHNAKTELLVSEIADFNYIITNSEQESLILEFNLIKQYSPRYNIRLMDDKTYPYLEITNEAHPRLIVSRYKEIPKNVTLFGPYPDQGAARETLRLLWRLYPLRRCNPIAKSPCIYYHIGQCLGPCAHPDSIDYKPNILAITKFLKGDTKEVLTMLQDKMEQASLALEFEKALEYREMITSVKTTTEKQIISLNDFIDRDFISFANNNDQVAIHILHMRQGRIIDAHQTVFSYVAAPIDEVMSYLQFYYQKVLMPEELVFDSQFNLDDLAICFDKKIIIPQKGDKKKLSDLCFKNAKNDLEHYNKIHASSYEKKQKAIASIEDIVGSKVSYIEVFDNAQLFGLAPISGLIVYKDLKFEKKMYRKYHTKSESKDDYQALREVIYRRYQRLLVEDATLPDLICVDGGKGQVSTTKEIIDTLGLTIPIVGLKKDRNHQLEALIYKNQVIPLDKRSELYQLMVSLSEEVHRYTISFHRQTRNTKSYQNKLASIEGLGKKRIAILLKNFNSIDEIVNADDDQLKKLGIPANVISKIKEGVK